MVLAFKNLTRNKLRTVLTLLGVAAGITLLVAITSYSAGLKDQIQQTVTKRFDLVIQSKGASSPLASRVSRSDHVRLQLVEGVSESPAIVIGAIKTAVIPYFIVAGTSSLEPLLGNLSLINGRFIQPGQGEVLLGHRALERFQLGVNDRIELNKGETFQIVGSFVTGSRLFDQGALLELENAQRLLQRQEAFNLVLVRLEPGRRADVVAKQIQALLPDLAVLKSRDLLGEIRLFLVVDQIAWGLSAVALVISCIFVSNTLMMSISERTKEIGILMAVGWRRSMIIKTVVTESLMICAFGGLTGIIGGWLLLWGFSRSSITGLDWTFGTLSFGNAGAAMTLALSVGLVSAIYPAVVASRLTPARALRFE